MLCIHSKLFYHCIFQALNYDFKEIASPVIPEDINRGKVESIKGNVVLMLTKVRNVAAPKVKEESGAAPRMLKISLSDGCMTCHGVEVTECPRISLKTPPGTKIKLRGEKLEVANGFIKLSDKSFEVLGGEVEALVEKWKVSQDLAEFTRSGAGGMSGEGPPKWIPFGQKNKMPKSDPSNKNFKALANGKTEENGEKESEEFDSKRQEALQEAAKGEQKKFGIGSKSIKETKALRDERARREKSDSIEKSGEWREETHERGGRGGRGGRGRGRGRGGRRGGDRDDEEGVQSSAPSGPVSLFDFLETQIPAKTPAAAAQCSKPETKTVNKEKPRTENYSRGGEKNPRDNNKDSRGGKRDFDSKGKFSTGQPSASRNDDKKKEVERKDNSDRRRDDSRKKGDNKKNDNRGGDRNSQPKEFAPVFHGKSADKNPEKLDKFERALLAEEAKNRSNKTETQKKPQQSRENSRTDLNNKQQNGYQYYDGRIQGKGGNDQDFGQWNGNNRGQRQPSNLGREDSLANGMQSMNIGGKERQQRGGFQGQSQRAHNRGRADQQQPLGSADGGQRGRGGCQGHQRPVWQEGQRCMAKYWEVRFNIRYQTQ